MQLREHPHAALHRVVCAAGHGSLAPATADRCSCQITGATSHEGQQQQLVKPEHVCIRCQRKSPVAFATLRGMVLKLREDDL